MDDEPVPPEGEPPPEQEPDTRPRVYVASLSDYNAGRLHGAWIDAAQEPDELAAAIHEMLAASREPLAEEWAIHDYEGFGALALGEYEDVATVAALARGIEEHGLAFAAFAAHLSPREPDLAERFSEAHLGTWDSPATFAEELMSDLGISAALEQVPDTFRLYISIDYDALAQDLILGGDIYIVERADGKVDVFNNVD